MADLIKNVPLYDAVPVTEDRVWRFFENGKPIGYVGAGPEHTNMPQSGRVGLPEDWTMRVERIRFVAGPKTCITKRGHLTFRVGGVERFVVTTTSLFAGPIDTPPVQLDPNVPFCAEVYWTDETEGHGADRPPVSTQIGDLLLKINTEHWAGKQAEEQMQGWGEIITRPALVWCVLEGPRTIVSV